MYIFEKKEVCFLIMENVFLTSSQCDKLGHVPTPEAVTLARGMGCF